MNYIVRADYYPNGEVVPLGITDGQGNSLFLKKIKAYRELEDNSLSFECLTNSNQTVILSFIDGKWVVKEG